MRVVVDVLQRGVRESLLEEVTFDWTWGKWRSKPHRNLVGVNSKQWKRHVQRPWDRKDGLGGRKANRATAKLMKQTVEEMRCSLFLAPRLLYFYLLNVSPIHFSLLFISDLILYYSWFLSLQSIPFKAIFRPTNTISKYVTLTLQSSAVFHGITQHHL